MTGLKEMNTNGNINYVTTEVFQNLINIGCCKICSLRYCGEINATSYKSFYELLEDQLRKESAEPDPKRVASNPCVGCLGMLQPPMSNKIIDKIIDSINKEDYDNPKFNIAITVPVSFYLRAHALLLFVFKNHPDYAKEHLPKTVVTVGVKDAWKYIFADKIGKSISKSFDPEASLKIEVEIQYSDDNIETKCLPDMCPDKTSHRKRAKDSGGGVGVMSRKGVESLLEVVEGELFTRHYAVPPIVPTRPAVCHRVLLEQNCILFGGKYNKYVRDLPQTAWLVQDQRKLETSVHEIIGECAQAMTKADSSKLIASGREDVDVRMLGSGRPFAIELANPRRTLLSAVDLSQLTTHINRSGAGRVSVSRLKLLNRACLEVLKHGEELKTKTYEAYCVVCGVGEGVVRGVSERGPVTLQQKTPVRVLHRRNIATRPRTIHWLRASDVKTDHDKVFFKLTLNTQAGTYIKEFIHGDFGRTTPSLGDLLGGVAADCLALDVMSIELDWPP